MPSVLIVGAGFAGAVHARTLAEAGCRVHMIDRRDHIGGNAFDFVDANGIRVHKYGPHIFHSRNRRIVDWVRRFSAFSPYTHKVRALLPNGTFAPIPINLDTVNLVFGTRFVTGAEVTAHLAAVAIPAPDPRDAAAWLNSRIGRELTDLLFRPYTRTMWGLELEEMAPAVVQRIPLRLDRTDGYFPSDEPQMMPRDGYTRLFENMLDHPEITVTLNEPFSRTMLAGFDACFSSIAIDEHFGFAFGPLPYRSIRFHTRTVPRSDRKGWAVTNFTDGGAFTRETLWAEFPHHIARDTGRETLTIEEPCDYRDNAWERYYPVRTADLRHQATYERYQILAREDATIQFIGRCGTYRYLDMDQVINQSLQSATAWLRERALAPAL
jgi:UDP-galactopyranose mutase